MFSYLMLPLAWLALCLPNLLWVSNGQRSDGWEIAISGMAFWCTWLALWGSSRRALLAALPLLGWWAISLYLRLTYLQPITTAFLGMALDTTPRELLEFFSIYGWRISLATVGLLLIIVAALWPSGNRNYIWRHRSRYWVLASAALLGLISWGMNFRLSSMNTHADGLDPFAESVSTDLFARWQKIYPLDLPLSALTIAQEQRRFNAERNKLKQFGFSAKITHPALDTVVLVIGESARRDRWSLYGYKRDTNPRLSTIKNLILFKNLISTSTATRSSVPTFISRRPVWRADGKTASDGEPSILRAFSEAGYSTAWISNQAQYGFYESPIVFYSRDAEQVKFLNPSSYSALGTFDEDTLPILKSSLSSPGRHFVVLHMLGSHFNYSHRYPLEYEKFTPALERDVLIKKSDAVSAVASNNAYDNTILYSDFVLSKVIDTVKTMGGRAAVIYASDHGEDIFESQCQGHGIERVSEKSYEIPGFIWLSEEIADQAVGTANSLRSAAAKPLTTRVLPQTLLDLAGIKVRGERTASLLAPELLPLRREVFSVAGSIDFDQAVQRNACVIGAPAEMVSQ